MSPLNRCLSAALLVVLAVFSLVPPTSADEVLEATLDNGLKVLLLEDVRSPIVTVQIWYRVGSRNEQPGITGISHLLEHLMFKGTPRVGPGAYAKIVEQNGGNDNAFTSQDHTAYYVNIAAEKIDIVLELEADRMQHLLLDPKAIESEREVVMEERRTRTEDNPVGALYEELASIAFKAHPYRWPVIGFMEEVRQISPADLRRYYQTYYAPNNAVLVVAGAFRAPQLLEKVRKLFGPIPRGPEPPKVRSVEPPQRGERRAVLKKEAHLPIVLIGSLVPTHQAQDAYALEVLSTVLSGGRTSRLYRRLVYEQQIALDAGGDYSFFSLDPSLFEFYSTVAPGQTAETVERALLAEVERLKQGFVSETELTRAKNQIEADFVFRQDSLFRRASMLARFEMIGGWRLIDRYLSGIRAVTGEDLQRVAKTYFTEESRNVAVLVPTKSETR